MADYQSPEQPLQGQTNEIGRKPVPDPEVVYSSRRFKDILAVLRRHQLTKGLTPVKLREILEDLGPTYVKLGQVMSMRSDMLPEPYCQELTKLRTEVKPFPFVTVLNVVEQELGQDPWTLFQSIDSLPLGSASIAQVHPAVLGDGRKVVLKVQRPHIKELMANDIQLMKKAAGILKLTIGTGDLIDFGMILDELWKTSQEEMDFIQEAHNCDLFYKNQEEIVYVTSPQVIHELTTPRLLVMDYIDGIRIDQTGDLESQGYHMTEIGGKAAENYCKQILEDGFFHADPHPGNLWISGGQIAWLDLGMAGHLSQHYKQLLRQGITAILKNDMYELKNVVLALGEAKERINHARLYTDIDDIVRKYMTMGFGNIQLGELIEKLLEMVKNHRISIHTDITLLGRSMVTIEGTLAACAPEVNMLQILTSYMSSLLLKEIDIKKELRHRARLLYTSMDKTLEIPAQLSDLLNITKNGQTKLNLEFSDSQETLGQLRRMWDRLVLALLCMGLFIGSALLCPKGLAPGSPGIPWQADIGFAGGGILALYLIISAIFHRKK